MLTPKPSHSHQGKPVTYRRDAQAGDESLGFQPGRGGQVLVEFGDGTTKVVPQNELQDYQLPADQPNNKEATGKQGAAQKDAQHESPASPVVRQEDVERQPGKKRTSKRSGARKKAGGSKRTKKAKTAKKASRKKRL